MEGKAKKGKDDYNKEMKGKGTMEKKVTPICCLRVITE